MKFEDISYLAQGDVVIMPVNEIPTSAEKDEKAYVLAHGEHTGHAHRLVDEDQNETEMSRMHGAPARKETPKNFAIMRDPKSNVTYLRVFKDTSLVHNEHKSFKIPVGDYLIKQIREKGMFNEFIRPVLD